VKEHWRDPGYWRWLWESRVSRDTKGMLVALLCISLVIGGYLSAVRLNEEPELTAVTSERLVTVVRKTPGGMTTEVVTETDMISRTRLRTRTLPGERVTVVRDGETVVVRRPSRTVTETVTRDGKVVTVRRPGTTVRETDTVERPTTTTVRETETRPGETVTGPGQTTTVTRDVPGPERTVTETTTETRALHTVTETETETETETVTVTDDSD
jgi:hypothetical protein